MTCPLMIGEKWMNNKPSWAYTPPPLGGFGTNIAGFVQATNMNKFRNIV